jgi:anti-sigma factor RsiW
MTFKHESHHNRHDKSDRPSPPAKASETNAELFELLSAYLDDEVSPEEREYVRELLETDSEAQRQYARLSKLHLGVLGMPTMAKHVELEPSSSVDLALNFELISAYLDGEVTVEERREVHELLDRDPNAKKLYFKLLKLRGGVQSLPVPASEQPVQETVQQVFEQIDRRRQHNVVTWGGTAVAALFVALLSGVLPLERSLETQQASVPRVRSSPTESVNPTIKPAPDVKIQQLPVEKAQESSVVARALFVE